MRTAIVFIVIFFIAINPSHLKGQEEDVKIFVSSPLFNSNKKLKIISEIKPGDKIYKGNYSIKAKLSWKEKEHQVVNKVRKMKINKEMIFPRENLGEKISANKGNYFQGSSNPSSRNIQRTSKAQAVSINKFDELQIIYEEPLPSSSHRLFLDMVVSGEKIGRNKLVTVENNFDNQINRFKSVKEIDLVSSQWKKKDKWYLLKRELDFYLDSNWRYTQSGKYTVVQRRFSLNLAKIGTMDLFFRTGPKGVNFDQFKCNIRLRSRGVIKTEEMVVCKQIPFRILKGEAGQFVRFNIEEFYKKFYADGKQTIDLKELIFFFPGNASNVIQENPLKKIVFQGLAINNNLKKLKTGRISSFSKQDNGLDDNSAKDSDLYIAWQIKQKKDNALIRGKLHYVNSQIEAIDFILMGADDIEGIVSDDCQLLFGYPEVNNSTEKINCSALPHGIVELAGQRVLRIIIGELISKRMQDTDRIYLKEVRFLLSGDINNKDFIDRIKFQGDEKKDHLKGKIPLDIHLRTKDLSLGQKQIILSLNDLREKIGNNAIIHDLKFAVTQNGKKIPSKVKNFRAEVVSFRTINRPLILDSGEQLSKRWGGPFIKHENISKNIENIRVKNFYPFPRLSKYSFNKGELALSSINIQGLNGGRFNLSELLPGEMTLEVFFNSNDEAISIKFPSIRFYSNDFEVKMFWEIKGPMELRLVKPYEKNIENGSFSFIAKQNTVPVVKIRPIKDLKIDQKKGILGKISLKRVEIRKGKIVFRVRLNDIVRERFPEREKVFLEEVIVFLPGKTSQVVPKRSLEKIVFHYIPEPDSKINRDPDHLDISLANWKRKNFLYILKRELGLSLDNDWHYIQDHEYVVLQHRFHRDILNIDVMDIQISPEISLEKVFASLRFGFGDRPKPAIELKWESLPQDMIVIPELEEIVQGHSTIGSKVFSQSYQSYSNKSEGFLSTEIRISPPQNVISKILRTDGLQVKGEGQLLELQWLISSDITKDTHFYLSIPKGTEFITSMDLLLISKGEVVDSILAAPNQPIKLGEDKNNIESLKVRLRLKKGFFNLTFDEIALFEPLALSLGQAIDFPVFSEGVFPLVPQNIQRYLDLKFSTYPGQLNIKLLPDNDSPTTVSWSTKIGQKMNLIKGLKVTNIHPKIMQSEQACWLNLIFITSRNKIDKKICRKENEEEIYFPMSNLFKGSGIRSDETLEAILWNVKIPGRTFLENNFSTFGMTMEFEGFEWSSIREKINRYPVVTWEGKEKFSFLLDPELSEDKKFGNQLLKIRDKVTVGELTSEIPLKVLDHPFLKMNSVIFEKTEPLTSHALKTLTGKMIDLGESRRSSQILQALKILIVLFGIWWGWKRKWLSRTFKQLIGLPNLLGLSPLTFWLFVATGFYLLEVIGLFFNGGKNVGFFLSVGSLAFLLSWQSITLVIRPSLENRLPQFAEKVYCGAGTPYIAGFLLSLAGATLFLILQLQLLAEFLMVIGYFMLGVGIILEINQMRSTLFRKECKKESLIEGETERA